MDEELVAIDLEGFDGLGRDPRDLEQAQNFASRFTGRTAELLANRELEHRAASPAVQLPQLRILVLELLQPFISVGSNPSYFFFQLK